MSLSIDAGGLLHMNKESKDSLRPARSRTDAEPVKSEIAGDSKSSTGLVKTSEKNQVPLGVLPVNDLKPQQLLMSLSVGLSTEESLESCLLNLHSHFTDVELAFPVPVFQLTAEYKADSCPDKINLSVGGMIANTIGMSTDQIAVL